MPILIDHDGKECYRSEAQIERMSAPPVSGPPLTPEQLKEFNASVRESFKKRGWKIPDKYKD